MVERSSVFEIRALKIVLDENITTAIFFAVGKNPVIGHNTKSFHETSQLYK